MSAAINFPIVNRPPDSILTEQIGNNQLLYFSVAVQEGFELDTDDRLRLTKFYEFESQGLNEKNAVQSAYNFMRGYMRCSEWDYMQDLLARKGEYVLEEHFGFEYPRNTLKMKAQILSKFVLNYLITLNAMCTGQNVRKISEYQWTRYNMHEVTLERVIDHAIHGDGTTFGHIELADICACLKKKSHEYQDLSVNLYILADKYKLSAELEEECQVVQKTALVALKTQEYKDLDPKRFSGDSYELYAKLTALRKDCDDLQNLLKRVNKELKIA